METRLYGNQALVFTVKRIYLYIIINAFSKELAIILFLCVVCLAYFTHHVDF